MNKKPDDYISVQKALEILLAFTPNNQEMGTMELSNKLGFHKSTVSRLLRVLTFYGFLQQDSKTKKIYAGQGGGRYRKRYQAISQ
jgi:DNA-binding IclR family transcriptional regulator